MSDEKRDRQLGMHRRITRRDFLNGVALGIGALGYSSVPSLASTLQNDSKATGPSVNTDPPALTGMRGSAPGSFDVAHSLRDGAFWETASSPIDTHETYDLVVVGGGISGLAAAQSWRPGLTRTICRYAQIDHPAACR